MPNFIECAKLTEDDFAQDEIAAEGVASWEITSAEATRSQSSGLPTTKIIFKVVDSKGHTKALTEFLPMSVDFRVKKIASATGTKQMAIEGRIDIDQWVGKTGKGHIKHEKSDGYRTKAVWGYFINNQEKPQDPSPSGGPNPVLPPETDFNDDVPF